MTPTELQRIRERVDLLARSPFQVPQADEDRATLLAEVDRLTDLLNTPELVDFGKAVVLEAAHQRERWGSDHDDGKAAEDWFWVLGYLGGKALRSHAHGDMEKALHHAITAAALLANWHSAMLGKTNMRPGIVPPEGL